MGFLSTFLNAALICGAFYMYQSRVYKRPQYKPVLETRPRYDYIVVGGGSAGSLLAARLSENPANTVLLLEAGPSDIGHAQISTPLRTPETFLSQFDWMFYSEPQTNTFLRLEGQKCYIPRGKVLGGSSSINYMQWSRGHKRDFDRWEELGCEGWSYKYVLPYFMKIEDFISSKEIDKDFRGTGGPMKITEIKGSQLAQDVVDAVKSIGYKESDYNGQTQEGVAHIQSNIYKGERWSSARAYLWPAAGRENLDIVTQAQVSKILTDKGRAVGVTYFSSQSPEKQLTVYAKREVIVAAGAIGSPHLLLLSGIGKKQHLEPLKIPVVADLPVGDNLQDHVITFVMVKTNNTVNIPAPTLYHQLEYQFFGTGPLASPGNNNAVAYVKTSAKLRQPDISFTLVEGFVDKAFMKVMPGVDTQLLQQWRIDLTGPGFLFMPALLQPWSKGSLRLKSANPLDYPAIDLQFFADGRDLETLVRGIRLIQKVIGAEALQKWGAHVDRTPIPGCEMVPFDSDEYWRCYLRHFSSTTHHASGTCKMGSPNDSTAVVDSRLRVKGIRGLRVADASVMPTIVSANTNAATTMIAERAAEFILQDNMSDS